MGVGEGKATQSSCYCSPLLHLPWAKSRAGTKTLPPQSPGRKFVDSEIYLDLIYFPLPLWFQPWPGSIITYVGQSRPSGPPGPALVPHCLSSLQQPPQGDCEHLSQIRPSPLPTALHGSHLPLGKKPKSSQWPVPTLPSLPLSDSAPATQASSSLFLRHTGLGPAPGPLHMPFPLSGMPFPRIS